MAEEAAGHPPEAVLAAGQPELLRPHFRRGGVVQRRVEGVDPLRQADAAAGDAGGERRRVADDEDVTIVVGGDRGQGGVAEVVVDGEVAERELVREGLVELSELLAIAEGHLRARRRERVGQDVEDVDPVPAVHLHLLVDEPGGDGQAIVRSDPDRGPAAGPVAGVDVLLHAEVGLHRVDVAAQPVVVPRHAQRRLAAQGRVEAQLGAAALVALVDRVAADLGEPPLHADLGLVGDVADRPRQRAGAEQGPLGAAQHLDARHVEQVDVRREQRQRDDRLVQVDPHLLLDARLVAHDLAGGDAPHRDLALAGPQVLHGEPAYVGGHALDVLDATPAQDFLGRGGDRERHVGHGLLALHGRDRDLLLQLRLEREVRRQSRAAVELEVLARLPAEAPQRHGHRIDAGGEGSGVASVGGGRHRLDGARRLIGDRDRGPRDGRAGAVADHAEDASGGRLGVGGRDACEDGERDRHQEPDAQGNHEASSFEVSAAGVTARSWPA